MFIFSLSDGYRAIRLRNPFVPPPSIPDRVKLNEKEATFFIQDIYEGEGLKGIPRGTVKSLRLHAYEYAYVKTRSDHNWHGIQSGWDIKRMLGTVPVEEDGSVIFKAPANTPISIQPLDKDGVAIQWMRSWVTGQPGEVVSCIGCHEDQNQIAIPKRVIASQKAPSALTLPEGGTRSFTFDLEVQPILDRACIACHNGEGKAFDLRGGKKDKLGYGTSYLNLHPYVHRQGGEGDMVVLQPYEYHPNTSELVRLLKKGHHNVKLTDKEWKTLYNWIDYNAPDKEGQMYHATADNFYLIPTAEVPVTNIYRDVILDEKDFPVKMTAYTPCFRREAGSYGKDVRGLNRLHQFDKVEIVQLSLPQNSYEALDGMVAHVESIVKSLGLPYRILRLCGGDMSFTSALTYDFEVYSEAQKRWLEVSSVSNFESFQANRLKLRYKDADKKTQLAHTLNGSSLALPRIVAALLENFQTPEGIRIPEALIPYTGFDIIK